MALGFDFSASGGSYMNFIKYNASAGRIFRRDKEDGEKTDTDITRNFKAVFDMENIECGWIMFDAGGAPSMAMEHWSKPRPSQPSPAHNKGSRVIIKLSKECGGDLRELASNAQSFLKGLDKLHDDYLAGVKTNPGKLPVVVLADTVPITTGDGTKKKSNFMPVFEIVSWVKRPDDLVYTPRGSSPANEQPEEAPARTPPSTGSTRAKAPAMAEDEDFG